MMTGKGVPERDFLKVEFGPDADIVILPRCCQTGECASCIIGEDLELVLHTTVQGFLRNNPGLVSELKDRHRESRAAKGGDRCRFEVLEDERL